MRPLEKEVDEKRGRYREKFKVLHFGGHEGRRLDLVRIGPRRRVELLHLPQFSISEQLLSRNVKRFRGGLVFKAHRLVYHSTLGLIVIKKKVRTTWRRGSGGAARASRRTRALIRTPAVQLLYKVTLQTELLYKQRPCNTCYCQTFRPHPCGTKMVHCL